MPKRIGHVLLIAAVLAVTGTHWFVLQSVAWTTMFAGNLRDGSFTEAMQKTFDGSHPCSLCRQIARGKQEEKKSETRVEWKKLEFVFAPATFVFQTPAFFWEIQPRHDPALTRAHAPLLPPPKFLRG